MKRDIQQAIAVLKNGGILIYPTDTAFGIGCRIDDRCSVDRLFDIRKRPQTQAAPILVSSIDMALPYFDSPSYIVRHFMDRYWPGALTIVAKARTDLLYSPIRGDGETVGIRMPDHQALRSIIAAVGVPILGPSANIHGEKTPFHSKDLDPALLARVDYAVTGTCCGSMTSTVVDCTSYPVKIIRQGAVILSFLTIDTSETSETKLELKVGGNTYKEIFRHPISSQNVLQVLETILSRCGMDITKLSMTAVSVGPGSFTGLRVGAAVAKTLGTLLSIPVNGRNASDEIRLLYGTDKWKN